MRRAFFPFLLSALAVAGCGDVERDESRADNFQSEAAAPDAVTTPETPVRIGEYGPSFEACAAAGTTRHVEPGATLPVRAAPFETGAATGAIPAGARFFLCTRSLDQKWFGIVYDDSGALAPRCGVSDPVTARRSYDGPCRSGWVASAFVKLIAGLDPPPPGQPNQPPSAPPAEGH
jgi:hypothetical protein